MADFGANCVKITEPRTILSAQGVAVHGEWRTMRAIYAVAEPIVNACY